MWWKPVPGVCVCVCVCNVCVCVCVCVCVLCMRVCVCVCVCGVCVWCVCVCVCVCVLCDLYYIMYMQTIYTVIHWQNAYIQTTYTKCTDTRMHACTYTYTHTTHGQKLILALSGHAQVTESSISNTIVVQPIVFLTPISSEWTFLSLGSEHTDRKRVLLGGMKLRRNPSRSQFISMLCCLSHCLPAVAARWAKPPRRN